MPVPKSKATLMITWHKAITGVVSLPKDYRQFSREWLINRGYTPLDDGDL